MSFNKKKPGRTIPGIRQDGEIESKRWPYLTLLVGALPGRMYRFRDPATVLGRSMDSDINLTDLGVSRFHARIERTGEGRVEFIDLGSTNGSFVNGQEVARAVLEDGDKIQLGPTVVLRYNLQDAVDEAFQRSQFEAMTRDGLTGCFNRLYLEEELRRELSFARRGGGSLSVAIVDVDHFKRVNDTWGHAAGDQALVEMAHKLRFMLREYDLLARYGGEEFALLMRATDIEVAHMVTERLRRGIEQMRVPINDGGSIQITISIGVSSMSEHPNAGPDELMRLADMRLYEAKRNGRNRVVASGSVVDPERQTNRVSDSKRHRIREDIETMATAAANSATSDAVAGKATQAVPRRRATSPIGGGFDLES